MADYRSYTLIRTLAANASQLLAVGSFRDLAAEFEAVAGSAGGNEYVPMEVEVVLKSSDSDALEAARTWLEAELDRLT